MTNHQISQQGLDARQVLESPAYDAAMTALRAQIVQTWKESPVTDREGQLLLLQLAKVADKFEAILNGMVESGKFAQHKIDLDSARNESAGRKLMRRVL